MPKVFSITSSVVIVGLCVAVALETRTILDLNHRLKAAEAKIAESAKLANMNQDELVTTREHNQALRQESEALRVRLGEGAAATPSPAKSEDKDGSKFGEAMSKMFKDPSMKKVMRGQQAMMLRTMYGDLIKQLGLSPDAADKFMDMMADRQMAMTEKGMAMMGGKMDAKQIAENSSDATASYDGKLQSLLGADGYSQFKDYEKTVGERAAMQQYQQFFTSSGVALDDSQSAQLLQIMIDERAKSPASPLSQNNGNPAAQMQALQSDQALHDFLAAQGDFNLRVYNRAGDVLTPDQLTAFQKIQQQMTDMQQMGIKMGQAMFKQQQQH
jgi:hypothetical protein